MAGKKDESVFIMSTRLDNLHLKILKADSRAAKARRQLYVARTRVSIANRRVMRADMAVIKSRQDFSQYCQGTKGP